MRSVARASWQKFYREQVGVNGLNLFLKATAAKLLWWSLLAQLTTVVFPGLYQTISMPGGAFFVVGAAVTAISTLWDKVKLPDFIKKFTDGDIYYELDNDSLNFYIPVLFGLNIVTHLPTDLLSRASAKFLK